MMGVALRGKTRWVAVAVVVAVALVVGLRSWLLLSEPPQSVVPKSPSVAPQPAAPSGPDWTLTAPLTLMPQPTAPPVSQSTPQSSVPAAPQTAPVTTTPAPLADELSPPLPPPS